MLDWGWWLAHEPSSAELAPVLADWFEQRGEPGWARWFREPHSPGERLAGFFDPVESFSVIAGREPVAVPQTRFEGPWMRTLHLLSAAGAEPELDRLLDAPVTAFLEDLVLHAWAQGVPLPPADPTDLLLELVLGPSDRFARRLRGLWLLDHALRPADLSRFTRLERLRTELQPSRYAHRGLAVLHTRTLPEGIELDLPALTVLDVDATDAGALVPVLRSIPTLRTLEIDAGGLPEVEVALRRGFCPSLREVRYWGTPDAPLIGGVRWVQQGPVDRQSIRVTSSWRRDTAVRAPG